jgi:hypothetical protein
MNTPEPFQPLEALASQDERDALQKLQQLRGPGGLRAALLALLLVPGQASRLQVWQDETAAFQGSHEVRVHIELLSHATRLPVFEMVLVRLAHTVLADRQDLLLAARRMIKAASPMLPMDRLMWFAIRRSFGEGYSSVSSSGFADEGLSHLTLFDMQHVVCFTAYLARMVPAGGVGLEVGTTDADHDLGQRWYRAVLVHWMDAATDIPPWSRPDIDALVNALGVLQSLSLTQRPQLVKTWVAEALVHTRPYVLAPLACDALRLTCDLLSTPMPPELARYYIGGLI